MNTQNNGASSATLPRLRRFLRKPLREKAKALKNRWNLFLSNIPVPRRLSLGFWWMRRNDNLAETLLKGVFEAAELAFVQKFLQPGMTVLDIGAHQGLYSLVASRRVGRSGRVFSFEPSPRERRALRLNLAINFSRNVTVEALALGSQETTADLYVVQGNQTGCNSLRPPDVYSSTLPIRVQVTTLDQWLSQLGISSIDFIKLDVEGAELDVLKGASTFLQIRPRPMILAEVQDARTVPWGYHAKEILTFLQNAGFSWLRLVHDGSLEKLDVGAESFEGNFLACPNESVEALQQAAGR